MNLGLVLISLYHIYIFSSGAFEIFPHRSTHLGAIMAVSFLTYSFSLKNTRRFFFIDIGLALIVLAIMVYQRVHADFLIYERVMLLPGSLTWLELFMGAFMILMVLEAGRRSMGPILGLLSILFLLHAYFGPRLGGLLQHPGYSVAQIIDFIVFTEQGLYSIPLGISSTYIIMFLIFAGLVQETGATEFYRDLALALAGRSRGGPAKVAVIGSAFIGSITGSAAANVAITGSVTIPMMKRAGFEPYFAGAVEAAASKGGHILPPVMAGTVFIMAELLGVSYWSICVAAFVPASLYFLGVFLQVHFYALKHQTKLIEKDELPRLWQTLKTGWWHFVPFIVLVGLLAWGYSPIWSALWSLPFSVFVPLAAKLVGSFFNKDARLGETVPELLKELGQILFNGLSRPVRAVRLVMLATALSGIIMGVVMGTGLGTKLMSSVSAISQDRLWVALLISAAVSFLLGLSLSMVASYILTAILIVPAAVTLGVEPLAAHLWAFYFSSLSTITPPVGATFYQAAALANSPPFKTGWAATRLAIAAFIIPVFFVYYPALLLIGSLKDTLVVITAATLSIVMLSIGLEGWLFARLSGVQRVLFILAGCLFLIIKPIVVTVNLLFIALIIFWNWRGSRTKLLKTA